MFINTMASLEEREGATCAICQCETNWDNLSYLPCMHSFHSECYGAYIKQKISVNCDIDCPICRYLHFKKGTADYRFIVAQMGLVSQNTSISPSPTAASLEDTSAPVTSTAVVIDIPSSEVAATKTEEISFVRKYKTLLIVIVTILVAIIIIGILML